MKVRNFDEIFQGGTYLYLAIGGRILSDRIP